MERKKRDAEPVEGQANELDHGKRDAHDDAPDKRDDAVFDDDGEPTGVRYRVVGLDVQLYHPPSDEVLKKAPWSRVWNETHYDTDGPLGSGEAWEFWYDEEPPYPPVDS